MERRRQPRLPFVATVEIRLRTDPRDPLLGSTRDICTTGLLVQGVAPLPPGTFCDLAIHLSSGDIDLPIKARGRVVRQACNPSTGGQGLGIQFVEMDDDSQELLWKVIRYNSPPTGEEE